MRITYWKVTITDFNGNENVEEYESARAVGETVEMNANFSKTISIETLFEEVEVCNQ